MRVMRNRIWVLLIGLWLLAGCKYDAQDFLPDGSAPLYEYTCEELWTSRGANRIYGQLFTPQGVKGRMPLCIMSHGFGGTHNNAHDYSEAMAQLGYMTYAFDFCGGGNYSRSDGETTQMSVLTECDDLEAVLDYFLSRNDVDHSRICLMGDSQGGLVTALTAARRADDVERICLFYPALNIPDMLYDYLGTLDRAPAAFPIGSVMVGNCYFADVWPLIGRVYDEIGAFRGKVLLVQGSADTTVPLASSDKAAYEVYGAQCEYHVIAGAGHVFAGNDRRRSLTYTIRFMKQ